MNKSYDRARQLLDQLGTAVSRPKHQPEQRATENGTCSRCNASVVWTNSPFGTRIPLDVHPEGGIVIRDDVAKSLEALEGERRYVPHFKACRAAQEGKS